MKQHIAWRDVRIGEDIVPVYAVGPDTPQTFVLVHGIGVSHRYFVRFMYELGKHYRVVAMDLPGFGVASRPKKVLNINELGEVVTELIRQESIKQPILVGHSMGSQIVASILMRHPRLAGKAILVGPTVNPKDRTRLSHVVRLLNDSLHEGFRVNRMVFGDYMKCGIRRYLRTLDYMLADHIEDRLPRCSADILVVRGKNDPIVPGEWAKKAAGLAHGRLLEIPKAPHVVQYARPKELARHFVEFAHAAGN